MHPWWLTPAQQHNSCLRSRCVSVQASSPAAGWNVPPPVRVISTPVLDKHSSRPLQIDECPGGGLGEPAADSGWVGWRSAARRMPVAAACRSTMLGTRRHRSHRLQPALLFSSSQLNAAELSRRPTMNPRSGRGWGTLAALFTPGSERVLRTPERRAPPRAGAGSA